MGTTGTVYCSDGDLHNLEKAKQFLVRAGRWSQINYTCGLAQEVLTQTPGKFDIVYNDVDKGDYPEMWELARERLGPGGIYIADNVLWGGRVARDHVEDDVVPGWTEAIQEHNALIANDPDFEFFINPIRDGLLVARKK